MYIAHRYSPELVAKLGHDYTVYAYDFSEYETPLVGQGMLSWILASASTTPNAPAEDSQTMVTGRVCKNILGIFSNGVKETLEVKLKLVPVPTCMQKEYVENMERYHSLSQLMPEGFDYSAWSDFLKENPTLSNLAQPTPGYAESSSQRLSFGGVEPFHQMLTRHSPSQEPARNDSFYDPNLSLNTQPTRASSPAMSTISFHHYQYNPDSRPPSRASVRSEAAPPTQQFPFSDPYVIEQQDEGPPKKRARITQAKRPRNTPLNAHNDSLRVTASTAASVRLHRPTLANSSASTDMVPRAPTPRPGDKAFGRRGHPRLPAPSTLRHASMDAGRPYMSPYDPTYSDNTIDSPDERDVSPDTPMDMPSSPPLAPNRTVSPAPSSPSLPTLRAPVDSGFVSDIAMGRDEDSMVFGGNTWEGSDLSIVNDDRVGSRQKRMRRSWQQINPGPIDRLPQSYVPRPRQLYRKSQCQPVTESIEQDLRDISVADIGTFDQDLFNSIQSQQQYMTNASGRSVQPSLSHLSEQSAPTNTFPFGQGQSQGMSQPTVSNAGSPDTATSHVSPVGEREEPTYSRSATPNLPLKQTKATKSRGLPRSHTWSGAGEPMSDAPTPTDPGNPRSGSGAKRRKHIKDRLEQAIAAGEMPQHCVNCGEIDTPTWRKAYTRVEPGSPEGIELSTDTASTDVIAYEVIDSPDDSSGEPKYRVFKNNLTREEKTLNNFEPLNLCNPCGLWLMKKAEMRPQKIWDKSCRQPPKRKRNPPGGLRSKSMSQGEDLVSDAIVPESDSAMPGDQHESGASSKCGVDAPMRPPPMLERAASIQTTTSGADLETAQAALRRAIQSSPAGLSGSRRSPINIDPDLTPRPTRRLLFPSPRKNGENKTLTDDAVPTSVASVTKPVIKEDLPKKPRCERCKGLKKACDRERPCKRCDDAGIGEDGCIPCEVPRTNWFEKPVALPVIIEQENPDKENCPPPSAPEVDDFADLFEDPVSPKTTPKKDHLFQDLLKTPTPGSRRRGLLTPRRGADDIDILTTPSRNIFTPRGTRAATIAPETPFTRQLNALLSDCPISSPSHDIDFSSFPTFDTPGRAGGQFSEFLNDDFLSSDMPLPSSPPKGGPLGLGFDLYEDPETATVGLWSGASMFGGENLAGLGNSSKRTSMDFNDGPDAAALLKMNVGGITVDFAAMIEEVVSAQRDADMNEDTKPVAISSVATSPEALSQGMGKTPEAPAVE